MTFHQDVPIPELEKPLKGNFEECVPEYDASFFNKTPEELFDFINAGNFLDQQGFLELGCAKVASLIRGKSVEEIRKMFNIQNDFTPEEEERLREENQWAEE